MKSYRIARVDALSTKGLALNHEDATLNELFASIPSGGTSTAASGRS
jgi:hypothetical protein